MSDALIGFLLAGLMLLKSLFVLKRVGQLAALGIVLGR